MKFTMQECGDAGFALLTWPNPHRHVPHSVRMPIDAVQRILDLQEAAEALLELDAAKKALSDLIASFASPDSERDWTLAQQADERLQRAHEARDTAVAKLKNPMREVPS